MSFNINITQTGFPIPTLKGNTLQDLEQEVLRYDKLYLNLRGMDFVLDFSDLIMEDYGCFYNILKM